MSIITKIIVIPKIIRPAHHHGLVNIISSSRSIITMSTSTQMRRRPPHSPATIAAVVRNQRKSYSSTIAQRHCHRLIRFSRKTSPITRRWLLRLRTNISHFHRRAAKMVISMLAWWTLRILTRTATRSWSCRISSSSSTRQSILTTTIFPRASTISRTVNTRTFGVKLTMKKWSTVLKLLLKSSANPMRMPSSTTSNLRRTMEAIQWFVAGKSAI